jgi:hypothetical protein
MCVQLEEINIISKFISIDCSVSVTRSVLKVLIKSIGISYHREMFIYFLSLPFFFCCLALSV